MDCGSPPKEKTHAGSLSFEFSYFGEKLVVNSGSPFVNDKKWIEAMRSTAAHSTISIDDVNSSDIFYQKILTQELLKYGQKYYLIKIAIGLIQHILVTKKYLVLFIIEKFI